MLNEVHVALAVGRNRYYFYAKDYLLPLKHFDEATSEYRKVLQLDPLSEVINPNLSVALMIAKVLRRSSRTISQDTGVGPKFVIA